MKTIALYPQKMKTVRNPELILLTYWFISNRHNPVIFSMLEAIDMEYSNQGLRVVALNPFNSQSDIDEYKYKNDIPLEMTYDHQHTGIFYNINQYPTFLLMFPNGRIIMRKSDVYDNLFSEISSELDKHFALELKPELTLAERHADYKNYLSLKSHNK